jgi:hypothetical protein
MNCQQIIPGLYLGSKADAQHQDLLPSGITHVLSLTCTLPQFALVRPSTSTESNNQSIDASSLSPPADPKSHPSPDSPQCKVLAVLDSNQQSLMPYFQEAFDFIGKQSFNSVDFELSVTI